MEDRYTGTGIIAINNRLRRLACNVDFTWSYVFSRETHLPTAVFPRGVHPTRFIHAATYQKIRETGSPDVPFSILDTLSLYFVINDSVLSLFSFFLPLLFFLPFFDLSFFPSIYRAVDKYFRVSNLLKRESIDSLRKYNFRWD